ncbi:TIGR01244 family sulfur transferase [Chelatococcus sp. GCM10030263]|uniref:TIGR01244 family sulfur transferase n=1 Tax=Chelatococcus sp. GCM10030263 TaxID=3273387 RepID=UPI003609AEDE
MKAVQINEKLWVAPQLGLDDLADLKAQGVTGVINNRPDGEEPGQPAAAEAAEAAKALGLTYRHVPFAGLGFDEALVRQNQEAIAASPGPVVAHCRSGTRSLTIWAIGEVLDGHMTVEEAEDLGARFGFDLAGVGRWIAYHRG